MMTHLAGRRRASMSNSAHRELIALARFRHTVRRLLVLCLIVLSVIGWPASRVQAGIGNLDPAFGKNGRVSVKFPGGFNQARSVIIQPDNKIVVAGSNAGSGNSDFVLSRYNADGSLDSSFGEGGKVATDFSISSDVAFSLLLQPDSK